MYSNDTHKTREICFSALPQQQAQQALVLLGDLDKLEVGPSPHVNSIWVRYNLHDYTLQGLENALISQGFRLRSSLLNKIVRALVHYCEEVQTDNMRAPERKQKNSREIYVKAYEHHPHGDHDSTPKEWREYR